jgi:hypothetical protein
MAQKGSWTAMSRGPSNGGHEGRTPAPVHRSGNGWLRRYLTVRYGFGEGRLTSHLGRSMHLIAINNTKTRRVRRGRRCSSEAVIARRLNSSQTRRIFAAVTLRRDDAVSAERRGEGPETRSHARALAAIPKSALDDLTPRRGSVRGSGLRDRQAVLARHREPGFDRLLDFGERLTRGVAESRT